MTLPPLPPPLMASDPSPGRPDTPDGEGAAPAPRAGGARFTARPLLLPDDDAGDGAPAPTDLDRAWGVTGGSAAPAADEPAALDSPGESAAEAIEADEPPDSLPGAVAEPDEVADVSMLAPEAPTPAPASDFMTHLPAEETVPESPEAVDEMPPTEDAAVEEAAFTVEDVEAVTDETDTPTEEADAPTETVAVETDAAADEIETPDASAGADTDPVAEAETRADDAGTPDAPLFEEAVFEASPAGEPADATGDSADDASADEPEPVAATADADPEPTDPDPVTPDPHTADAPADLVAEAISDDVAVETADEVAEAAAEDAADAVNDAFDAATAPGKRDRPAPVAGVEGTLDVAMLGPDDFAPDDLKAVLRTMLTSRRLDEKMLTLLKQGKGFFHIGSSGHEAAQIALGREMRGGHDAFCFYYRDLGTALSLGLTPEEVLQAHFGKADDPFGGGRQMPEHFGHKELNIMSTSSSVGAQYLPAVGFALAHRRDGTEGGPDGKVVYSSGGEGSTSQGAFHEALNWAARESLPVLFHIQDNGYAISVPVTEQTAGGSIWPLFSGYAGLERLRYDGTDFFQAASAARAAVAHARAGHGPVALHADVVRLLPHSSSDDHGKYRESEVLDAERDRDPIPRFVARLVEAGVVTEAEVEAMRAEIHAEIDDLARAVEAQADPDPATATRHVYYEGPDEREYELDGPAGDLIVMVDAINHALDEEMARDERVLVYGEDVGGGKGGVFTATRGLTAKHGRDRCFNSPLAEHSIIGSAVGLACAGYKPVVEIQFADYVWPGMQPLRNQVASMRYRSNGAWANPMVIRMPCGGYIHGGLCHSQNVEAMFAHWPGLQVVMPSNAADAKGLLKSAIRGNDPVIFLEHKSLYRQGPARRPEPHADYLVPIGKAAVTREGTDLTIVTWGAIVYRSLNAARALEKEGVSVEVVDIRSMYPLDIETILASARKTGRVLVAYEDHEFMGFGAEVAAQVSKLAFHDLDAPVHRVAGAFSSIPYADPLEAVVLPQDDHVLAAAREVLAF